MFFIRSKIACAVLHRVEKSKATSLFERVKTHQGIFAGAGAWKEVLSRAFIKSERVIGDGKVSLLKTPEIGTAAAV